jgi:hypothetical protein
VLELRPEHPQSPDKAIPPLSGADFFKELNRQEDH